MTDLEPAIIDPEPTQKLLDSWKGKTEFSQDDGFTLAEALSKEYLSKVWIEKYGWIPENILTIAYRRLEELTKDSERPVVYFECDKGTLDSLFSEDSTDFYKKLVGRWIEAVGKTRYSENEEFKRIVDMYNEDFKLLYNKGWYKFKSGHWREGRKPYFDTLNGWFPIHFDQLATSVAEDIENSPMVFKYPIFLVNISSLDNINLRFEEHERLKEKSEEVLGNESEKARLRNAIIFPHGLMDGAKNMHKIISVPGWTLPVSRYLAEKPGMHSISVVKCLFEEIGYMRVKIEV